MLIKSKSLFILSIVACLAIPAIDAQAAVKKIKNFDRYEKTSLGKTEFMPTREMVNTKAKNVAVAPVELGGEKAEGADKKIANLLQNKLESLVQEAATLMDRNISSNIGAELRRNELTEGTLPTGNINTANADIAIVADIIDVTVSTEFQPAKSGVDLFKNAYSNPAECKVTLGFTATVKIVDLSNMKVTRIDKDGSGTHSVVAPSCGRAGDMLKANFSALSSTAINDVVKEVASPLLGLLVPTAYVLEKRTFKKYNMFKISLGKREGVENAQKAVFYTQSSSENILTGEQEIEEMQIASGLMTNQLSSTSSWVYVKKAAEANKVRLGDTVKLTYKKRGGFALGDIKLGDIKLW